MLCFVVLEETDSPSLCSTGSGLHRCRRRLLGLATHAAHGGPHPRPGGLRHARGGGRHARHIARIRAAAPTRAPAHNHRLAWALAMHGAAGVHPQAVAVHAWARATVAGVGRSAVIGCSRVVTCGKAENVLFTACQGVSRPVKCTQLLFYLMEEPSVSLGFGCDILAAGQDC